jgi:hypothetical protein
MNCSEIPPYELLGNRSFWRWHFNRAISGEIIRGGRSHTTLHDFSNSTLIGVSRQFHVLYVPLYYIDMGLHVRRVIVNFSACPEESLLSRSDRPEWNPSSPDVIDELVWDANLRQLLDMRVHDWKTGKSSSRLSMPTATLLVHVVRLTHGTSMVSCCSHPGEEVYVDDHSMLLSWRTTMQRLPSSQICYFHPRTQKGISY